MTDDSKQNLPAIPDDGFDSDDNENLIQGSRLVCDVTQPVAWMLQPGGVPVEVNCERLVMTSRTALRKWLNNRVVETIVKVKGQAFPTADELNGREPRSEWRPGMTGELVGPWQMAWFVQLLDVQSGERMTFVTTSIGGRIAVTDLREDIAWMKKLRGAEVAPIVTLGLKPFPTKYGLKQRPWLRPVRWVHMGGEGLTPVLEHKPELKALPSDEERRAAGFNPDAVVQVLKPAKPVTTKEAISDELPDDDPNFDHSQPAPKRKAKRGS
jgi:hypothetical protein